MTPVRALRRASRSLAFVLCAAAAGCGGGGQGECTRGDKDPDALREQAACVRDNDCPCGGHCDLGICAFECLSKGDCDSGERCDLRGRCRPASDPSNLAPPPATALGRVETVNPLVGIQESSEPRRVDFRVLDRPVDRLRVVAEPGLEVSCEGPEGPFAPHCLRTDVAPGRHRVFIAPDREAMEPDQSQWNVAVHTAVDRLSIGVQRAGTEEPIREEISAHTGAHAGRYEGTARLEEIGFEQDDVPVVGELEMTAPLTAKVHRADGPQQAYVFEIDDPLHLFGADAHWLFAATWQATDERWEVTAPLRPYLGAAGSSALEVHAKPVVEDVRFGEVLAVDVRLELEGLHGGGGLALAEWRLRLRRTDELASDTAMPELPAPVVSGERAMRLEAISERTDAPLPWETVVHEAMRDPFGADAVARGATLAGAPTLWQCETEAVSSAEAICRAYWTEKAPAEDPCTDHADALADGHIICETGGLGDCDEMAAQLGCPVTPDDYCILDDARRVQSLGQLERAQSCPQLYACWQAPETPDGSDLGQLGAPLLDADLAPASLATLGDLRCEAGTRIFAPELIANADRDVVDRLNARAMLDACAQDLERYQEGPPAVTAEHAQALDELTGSAGCFEPWRLEPALAHALAIERARALGDADAADGISNSLGMRLSYQWAETLGLVAREALNSETLTTILSVDDAPIESNPRSLDEYVDLSLQGWDLLLHPRIASGLLKIPGATLADPDYREFVADAPLEETSPVHHQQGIGLPVIFAESVSSQLDAARQLVRRARFTATGHEATGARARRAIGYAVAVLSVADALALRAMPHSPAWASRWHGARGLARGSLTGLVRETAAMLRGDNPLGIDDADLPLYFFGDEETASERFSAISDFLIGASPSMRSQAWAPAAVERAMGSLQDARAEWVALRERELADTIDATDGSRRIAGITREFGKRVLQYCGNPDWSEMTILDEWTGSGNYTPSTCYIANTPECSSLRSSGPGTDAALGDAIDDIDEADVQVALCVAQRLRTENVDVGHPDAGAGVNDAIEQGTVEPVALQRSGLDRTATVDGVTFPLAQLYELAYGFAPLDVLSGVTDTCASRYPDGNPVLPQPSDAEARTPDPNCFSGSLGDARLAITNARQELEIARTELEEMKDAFYIAIEACIQQDRNRETINQLEDARDGVVGVLRAAKLVADIATLAYDTVLKTDKSNPLATIGDTAAAAGKVTTGSISLGLEFAIAEVLDGFNNRIGELERENQSIACAADARQKLVGAGSAGLRIDRAALDLESAMADFALMQDTLRRVVDDGRAVAESERARIDTVEAARAPLANERWVSEKVERFRREHRLAQRLVYLAVRAVEYEFQMSLPERGRTLAALHPAELRAVLDDLLATAGTRKLDGKSPSELVTVVSLKRDLLHDGTFDEHAVDSGGEYAGVKIPFRLIPSAFDGAGEGVEVFADGDCAERLWSVNASIVGKDGEELWIGDDPSSFVRVDLRKANAFFSQWCDGRRSESPYQLASVRPAVNLFVDPGLGRPGGVEDSTTPPDETFTTARIRAFTDVPRAELETDAYMEGETAELAARGLYGDYELVIPANVLSREGGDGLVLDNVDDILIRLEYVSVAR